MNATWKNTGQALFTKIVSADFLGRETVVKHEELCMSWSNEETPTQRDKNVLLKSTAATKETYEVGRTTMDRWMDGYKDTESEEQGLITFLCKVEEKEGEGESKISPNVKWIEIDESQNTRGNLN